MPVAAFKTWLSGQDIARTVLFIQQHHTFSPAYCHFDGQNHFALQQSMKHHHVTNNGWSDIGQQLTIFPDGKVATGRSMERAPACIFGNNRHAVCIENVGFFDEHQDVMNPAQEEAILEVTAALCQKFNIPITTDRIVYHHWFDLSTGVRTNGSGSTKSCPGTNFFGGNSLDNCQNHFLPRLRQKITGPLDGVPPAALQFYGWVTANRLNIRKGPKASFDIIGQSRLGAVLRIYDQKERWYKISNSKEEWVYGNYVQKIHRATVNTDVLNVRSGPSTQFHVVGAVLQNQEVFAYEEKDGWSRIGIDQQWVSNHFLDITS